MSSYRKLFHESIKSQKLWILFQKIAYKLNTCWRPVTIMDRLVVNTYKRVVPDWCFAKVGKFFCKIQKWPRFDKLISERFLYSQRSNIIRRIALSLQRGSRSWPVRKNSTNSFNFPLLWGSRYRWIHFALRARLKLCKSSILRLPSAKSLIISVLLTLHCFPSYRNFKKTSFISLR